LKLTSWLWLFPAVWVWWQGVFKHDETTHRLLIYIFCSAVVEKKRRSAVFLWNGCPARFEFRLVIITPSKGTNAEGGYNVTTTYVSERRVGWPGMTTYTNRDRLTRLTQRLENRLAHFMGGNWPTRAFSPTTPVYSSYLFSRRQSKFPYGAQSNTGESELGKPNPYQKRLSV
jgi:hypothetical protein